MLDLPAVVTHDQALAVAQSLSSQVVSQKDDVVLNVSALRQFDSSALAVMLASRRAALAAGKTFALRGLPPNLAQLARLYGVTDLIPPAA